MVIRVEIRFNYIIELGSHLKKRRGSAFFFIFFLLVKVCYTSAQMGRSERSLCNRTIYFLSVTTVFLIVLVSYWWVTQRVGVGGCTGSSLYFCEEWCWYKYLVYQNIVVTHSPFIYSLLLNVSVLKTTWVV